MALVTHTTLKAAPKDGLVPESVMQQIWDISRIPLPFSDMIGSGTHENEYTSWLLDKLADPNTANAELDGADPTGDANALPTRVGNHSQISVKRVSASTRARQGGTIAMGDALSYQVMQRQRELRRDVEAIALFNQASVQDNGTNAGKAAGLDAWLTSNTSNGATGSNGGFNTTTGIVAVAAPGTKRAGSEATLRNLLQAVWEDGGNPTVLMGRPPVIRSLSAYMFSSSAQVATLTSDVREKQGGAVATGSVNVFVTDFGVVCEMVANRLQPVTAAATSTLFAMDPEYAALSYLSGYRVDDLAKSGLSDKKLMSVDWTLKVYNESAFAAYRAIDEALAWVA
jgi:hypothetical protein